MLRTMSWNHHLEKSKLSPTNYWLSAVYKFRSCPISSKYRYTVALPTPIIPAISTADFFCLYNITAVSAFFFASGLNPSFSHPLYPLSFAAEIPALVRSRMVSRSNSANQPKMFSNKRPWTVDVSIESLIEVKFTLFTLKISIRFISSFNNRARRSNFQTITESPSRRFSIILINWGRSFPEDTFS